MLGISTIETKSTTSTPTIAYDVCGRGETIIFLHGIGGNRTNWREQLIAIGKHCRAVAWDARGYGLSEDYDGALTFDVFNDDLIKLMDHLDVKRAVFVGLSMGGRILQHFYRHHPDRVQAAILCDTLERPSDADPGFRAKFLADRKTPLLSGKTPRDIAPELASLLASANCAPEHLAVLIESLSSLRVQSYLKALDAVAEHDSIAQLPDFQIPVLLIYGAEDRVTPPELGRDLARRIRLSEFQLIQNAGHLSNIERPNEFNALLLEFVQRVCRN